MALFAGDSPIQTGDELTYDYNFDPFSAKNVQECRCGSDNCRGILGPRPKDAKPSKESIKETVKATVKAGKRKLKEMFGAEDNDEDDNSRSPKKRKIKEAKGIKRSASSASMKVAKDVASAVRKSVANQLSNARQAVSVKRGGSVISRKSTKVKALRTYGSDQKKMSSRNSSLTMVASSSSSLKGSLKSGKGTSLSVRGANSITKNVVRSIRSGGRVGMSRARSSGTIRVISDAGEE